MYLAIGTGPEGGCIRYNIISRIIFNLEAVRYTLVLGVLCGWK